MSLLNTRKIALLSVLAAVSLGIQLTPRPMNVESTSLLTFLVGVLYGGIIGGFFGGSVMFVNGFLSPWGYGGLVIPFQMAGMAAIGFTAGIYRRFLNRLDFARTSVEVAVLGAFLTILYDIITNTGVAIQIASAETPLIIALISVFSTGVFASAIHTGSNIILFASGFMPLLKALQNIPGGEALWSRKELLHS